MQNRMGAIAVVLGLALSAYATDYVWTDGYYFNSTVNPGLPDTLGAGDTLTIGPKIVADYSLNEHTGLKVFYDVTPPDHRWLLTNLGSIYWTDGAYPIYTQAADQLDNQGLLEAQVSGEFWRYRGGWGDCILHNNTTGTIRMAVDGTLTLPFANMYWDETLFFNSGTLSAQNLGSTIRYETPMMEFRDGTRFTGAGTHRIAAHGGGDGTNHPEPYVTFAGSIAVDPGATVQFYGDNQHNRFVGKDATLHGAIDLPQGTMSGSWTVAADGAIHAVGSSGKALRHGSLVNHGQINLKSGNLAFADMTLTSDGTIDFQGDYNFGRDGLSNWPTLINQGVIRKSAGNGVSQLGAAGDPASGGLYFSNSATGSIQVQTGTLVILGDNFTDNYGEMAVTAGAALHLLKPLTNYGEIHGGGAIKILDHNYTLTNAGQIAPGQSPGTLTIDGDFVQTAAGTLTIEIGGTGAGQFDVLHVTGDAAIDGTLRLVLLPGYAPQIGDTFAFLVADSIVGDFPNVLVTGGSGAAFGDVTFVDGVASVAVSIIPEPATFAWLSLAVLAALRRRSATNRR